MKHLKFKKGESNTYEAILVINGDIYTFCINGGQDYACNFWGYSVYCNDGLLFSDGWNYSTKKTWVNASESDANDLVNGKNPF